MLKNLWNSPFLKRIRLAFLVGLVFVGAFKGVSFLYGKVPLAQDIWPVLLIGFVGGLSFYLIFGNIEKYWVDLSQRRTEAETNAKINPDKAKPAWDLASLTLEAYFARNLSQISWIFWLCVGVMMAGFGLISWSIVKIGPDSTPSDAAYTTAVAGVITELIGATFLFVYRSTITQASNYTKILERINTVGMAMQILDAIPDDANAETLKNKTKAEVVRLLMQQANSLPADLPLPEVPTKPESK